MILFPIPFCDGLPLDRGIITSLVDPLRIIRGRKFTIWERNVDLEMMDIWVLWS